ncbi:MAG: hypothetical protein ACSHWY_03930 [Octadecabacter sp.]
MPKSANAIVAHASVARARTANLMGWKWLTLADCIAGTDITNLTHWVCDVYALRLLKISLTRCLEFVHPAQHAGRLLQTFGLLLTLPVHLALLRAVIAIAFSTVADRLNTTVNALIYKATEDHIQNSFHGIVLCELHLHHYVYRTSDAISQIIP